jgi:hypothetical protein
MKRQRADFQIRCFGENYTGHARSEVSLKLALYIKSGPMFPLTAYVFVCIMYVCHTRFRKFSSSTPSYTYAILFADSNLISESVIDSFVNRN